MSSFNSDPLSFTVWGIIFFSLLLARPLLVIAVGLADVGSLPIPRGLGIALGSAMLLPALWTGHSVKKYFGFARALGGDHFFAARRRRALRPLARRGLIGDEPRTSANEAEAG